MHIKLFSGNYISTLKAEVAGGSINRYMDSPFKYENKFSKGFSVIALPDEQSPLISTANSDFDNSKKLFEAMPELSRVQAADERLWTTLAHINFWDYMEKRWPVKKTSDALSHYYFSPGNLKSYYRHGIARLWWFAYLTIDDSRADKYELTKILFKDQDYALNILERGIGRSRNILHGLLDHIKEKGLNRNETRDIAKYLNFSGGINLLDSHNDSEVKNILSKVS